MIQTTTDVSVAMATTSHFDWVATGPTPEAAREALLAGWREHCRENPGADPAYLAECGINVLTGPVGQAWRDYHPLLAQTPPTEPRVGVCRTCWHWEKNPDVHQACPWCGNPWAVEAPQEAFGPYIQMRLDREEQAERSAIAHVGAGSEADSWDWVLAGRQRRNATAKLAYQLIAKGDVDGLLALASIWGGRGE